MAVSQADQCFSSLLLDNGHAKWLVKCKASWVASRRGDSWHYLACMLCLAGASAGVATRVSGLQSVSSLHAAYAGH